MTPPQAVAPTLVWGLLTGLPGGRRRRDVQQNIQRQTINVAKEPKALTHRIKRSLVTHLDKVLGLDQVLIQVLIRTVLVRI